MKIASRHAARKPALAAGPLLARIALITAGTLIVLAIALLVLQPTAVQSGLRSLEVRWGNAFRQADPGLVDKWSIATGAYLRQFSGDIPELPEVVLDIPFAEMTKIYAKREEALARGILVQGEDDFVRGSMRFVGQTIPIDLRLKGDWNDHLTGRKWSFRVHIRDDQHLFGMRRFSLQNPNTRGFQSEEMFFQMLKRYDVLVPRYTFVELTLNGDSMGIMAVEEFFATELLEHQQRRDGVIIRFNENLAWSARDAITGQSVGWGGAFDYYKNAPIDPFGSGRVTRSPVLSEQYRIAEGLLRGFTEGKLQASEAFDVERLGAFLGTAEFFGAWHTTVWHNMRFYLNPVSLRLEPVAFDVTLQEGLWDTVSITQKSRIAVDMLRDQQVWQRYKYVLRDLAAAWEDGSLAEDLRRVEDLHLPALRTEFRMLPRYPLDYLGPRSAALLAWTEADAIPDPDALYFLPREMDQYPVLLHLGLVELQGQDWLRIDTAIPRDVRVTAIDWVNSATGQRLPATATNSLPLWFPARGITASGQRLDVALVPVSGDASAWTLEVTAGLDGRNWTRSFIPQRVYPALDAAPSPQLPLARLLRSHGEGALDDKLSRVVIGEGLGR